MKRKKQRPSQLSLFDSYGQALHLVHRDGIVTEGVEVVDFLSRLEEQKSSTTVLLTKIMSYENLEAACRQVEQNKGGSGVDELSIKQTIEWIRNNHSSLIEDVLNGRYKVKEVLKVEIDKPDGGKRKLGIPTVLDRVLQQAIHQKLSPLYDRHFSESSYGFRPKRNGHQAILQSRDYISAGGEWVVDIDLEKYFDSIPHDRLIQRLSKGVGDKRLLKLITQYLRAGLMEGGMVEQRIKGSPQGGPLSPLLSNIVLDELDRELEKRGHKFCRYADDCNIYVNSEKAGKRVMTSLIEFIERKLKLKVNREKSGVRHCNTVRFLGYTIKSGGKIRVSDKSLKRLKTKIVELTKRNLGHSFKEVITGLNRIILGWGNYYKLADTHISDIRKVDRQIRNRLRCYRIKQAGRTYTIVKLLRTLGINEQTCWNIAYWRQGYWSKSSHPKLRQAMNPNWFAQMGLHSVERVILKFNC